MKKSSNNKLSILFIMDDKNMFRELIPIALEFKNNAKTPIFILSSGWQSIINTLKSFKIKYYIVNKNYLTVKDNVPQSISSSKRNDLVSRSLRSFKNINILRQLVKFFGIDIFLKYLRIIRVHKKFASQINSEVNPSSLIMGSDTSILSMSFLNFNDNIPSFTIHWAHSSPKEQYSLISNYHRNLALKKSLLELILIPYIHIFVPQGIKIFNEKYIYRSNPIIIFLLSIFGLYPKAPWVYGGGSSKSFIIPSKLIYEKYKNQSLPKKEIIYAGQPSHSLFKEKSENIDRLKYELNIDNFKKIFLFASDIGGLKNKASINIIKRDISFIVEELLKIEEEILILIKIHPSVDKMSDYSFLKNKSSKILIIDNYDIEKIIPNVDIFCTVMSSTIAFALGCGVPAITVNFNKIPYFDFLKDWNLTSCHLKSKDKFGQIIKKILFDIDFKDKFLREQNRCKIQHINDCGNNAEYVYERINSSL